MNNYKISFFIILPILLLIDLTFAEDENRSKGLTQLDFDKNSDKSPTPPPQDSVSELFEVINNEAQIKELDTTKLPGGSEGNLGDSPIEDTSRKPINQLD